MPFDPKAVITGLTILAAGQLIAFVVAIHKLLTELSYLKGQLSLVLSTLAAVDKLKESHAILSNAHFGTQKDVSIAFEKIRQIERRESNGSR